MAFKFFLVPISDSGEAETSLNVFLRSHKVLAVDRRWVEQGAASFWTFCVDYLESDSASSYGSAYRNTSAKPKIDYKEILTPEQFNLFAKLRDIRKEMAQAEAVPVYTIFTNEQLAQMVQQKTTTKAALEKITGIGDARVARYGARVLEALVAAWPSNHHEASGSSIRSDP